jgi:hypothetical protein
MHSHSLFCLLLVLATVACGGQKDRPEARWLQRERMQMPATFRPTPPHNLSGPNVPNAYLCPPHRIPVWPGKWDAASSRFIPITSGAPDDRISTILGAAPSSPVIARELSSHSAGRINTTSATTSTLAPFDTVREIGGYGERIHVFSYEHGRLTRMVSSHRVNGVWNVEGSAAFSYTSSGLLKKRTTSSNQYPYCKVVDSFRYDQEGRVISARNDGYQGLEEAPWWASFDTTAYDSRGNETYHRTEYWNPAELDHGGESIVVVTDTSTIATFAEFRGGAWVNTYRNSVYGSAGSGRRTYFYQTWNGTTWTNIFMDVTIFDNEQRPLHDSFCRWQGDTCIEVGRVSFGYDASGYSRDWEEWDGTVWVPFWQERCTTDAMGRTLRYSWMLWDHGWIPLSTYTCEYGADGNIHARDSSWTDGRLGAIGASWTDASGRSLQSECIYQNAPDSAWEGIRQTNTYTPGGNELEVSYHSWAGAAWHPTRQYVFMYDGENRVRSVTVFEGRNEQWIASRDLRISEPSTTRGGGWSFDPNDPMMSFEFDVLTFTYRTGAAGIGAIVGETPEHSTLGQNYPNPFNPATTIPFSVAPGARTSVVIYDILGREVARPVDEWKDPGEYRVEFNANGLASGMYLCRFSSGSVTQTQKLILVR